MSMKKCAIFGAAGFDALAEPLDDDTLIIAADGGLRHLQKLGRKPDVILGDFDSLGYIPAGAVVYPAEKDDTDAMLAARLGLARGCQRFVIYGGMDGVRLDHTLANLQMLGFLAERGSLGYLVGETCLATVVQADCLRFPAGNSGIVSVFCQGGDATGVRLRGLKYPLEEGVLTSGYPLGVSNRFIGEMAEISVQKGKLLVLWERNNGFPER